MSDFALVDERSSWRAKKRHNWRGVGSGIPYVPGGWKRPVDGVGGVLVQGVRHTRRLAVRRDNIDARTKRVSVRNWPSPEKGAGYPDWLVTLPSLLRRSFAGTSEVHYKVH